MIRRQLLTFLFIGAASACVDYATYRCALWIITQNVNIAKCCGFVGGTLFAYVANKSVTFRSNTHARGTVWRFAVLYGLSLCVNVGINRVLLGAFSSLSHAIFLAFFFATGASATLNFVGMKWFVFKSRSSEQAT